MTKTLKVFTDKQLNYVQQLLATKVVQMGGRKLEEGDWTEIYCAALEIVDKGWSNLNIDVVFGNIGIEQKLIRTKSVADIEKACGTSFMHPSATRSFRIDSDTSKDANEAMRSVFEQYAKLIDDRKAYVRAESKLGIADAVEMRTGWLLWQDSLRQFLYFEEHMVAPKPDDYYACWQVNPARGARKSSVTLWVYEKASKTKKYSITTDAGAKIQPYVLVPTPEDDNLYIFTVIGEVIQNKYVRAWITERTWKDLKATLGDIEPDALSSTILEIVGEGAELDHAELTAFMKSEEAAKALEMSEEAYDALCSAFVAANDELRVRALLVHLHAIGA